MYISAVIFVCGIFLKAQIVATMNLNLQSQNQHTNILYLAVQ
jgi:hypothetical protein